jgi:peptide/nickel transport system substrate-binding protein
MRLPIAPLRPRSTALALSVVAVLVATGAPGLAASRTTRSPARVRPQTTATAPSTAPSAPTTVAPPQRTLRIATAFPPRAGLSVHSDDAVLLTRLGVTDTLVRATSSGEAAPALALSWEQVTATRWRFSLRPNVSFHDGTALDAAGAANAITRAATASTPPRSLRGTAMTATATGPLTLEVTTGRPDPLVPLRLASPGSAILAPNAYKTTPPNPIGFGSGSYRITAYEPGRQIDLVATPSWARTPTIEKVTVRLLADPAARAAALRAGEVDLAEGLPPAQLAAVRSDPKLDVFLYDLPRTTTLYLNASRAPFDSGVARRAIDLAIDRKVLAETLLEGAAVPAAGYFGPAVAWDPDKTPPRQNLAEARRLATQAGLSKPVRLWTYPARAELPDLAVAIKDMLGRAGIEVEITVAEYGTLEPDVLGGRHDLFLLSRSYMVDVADPAAFLQSDFTCSGGYNLNRFCESRLDSVIASLERPLVRSERERAFAAAARLLDVETVGVPVLHDRARIGHVRALRGLSPDPLEQRLLTAELRLGD